MKIYVIVYLCYIYYKGDDDYGKTLLAKSKEAGVNMKPQINKEHSTGTCAVVITGSKRSLVANLAAANHFKKTHFDVKENWDIVEKADYFYIGVNFYFYANFKMC